jgi:hypothetical protein
MFETIGRLAERAAGTAGVSRRGFLVRLGRGAVAAAGAVGGLLLLPGDAHAADIRGCVNKCCKAACGDTKCSCDTDRTIYGGCYSDCASRGL